MTMKLWYFVGEKLNLCGRYNESTDILPTKKSYNFPINTVYIFFGVWFMKSHVPHCYFSLDIVEEPSMLARIVAVPFPAI